MTIFRRCVSGLLLLACVNAVLLAHLIPGPAATAVAVILAVAYVYMHIVPVWGSAPLSRLQVLQGGYELAVLTILCFTMEIPVYLWLICRAEGIPAHILIINALVGALLLFALLLNGLVRIVFCSKQVGLATKLLLLFLWWVPVVNVILLKNMLDTSRREYVFTLGRQRRNEERLHERLCATRYPLLMVHGIFFRDWEKFNYWGRVPGELIKNGAVVHYGNQQSSASVEQCAGELRQTILDILAESGCEKVNIIAHSKGGLDARCAISCLGMGAHVASLTTINTPHQGCNYVAKLLDKISDKTVGAIGEKYEQAFAKLGDSDPHFFSGLKNLTDKECRRLNAQMPDDGRVVYQSIGSRMRRAGGAIFPLNLGYSIIRFFGGGDNDGLVSVQSMPWGNFLGVLSPKTGQGISHGDMIDLTRKDVPGFDVCEFYVDLVHGLQRQGL